MRRVRTNSPTRKQTPSDRAPAPRRSRDQAAPAEAKTAPRRVESQQAQKDAQSAVPQAANVVSQAANVAPRAGGKQRLAQSCVAKILEKLLNSGLDGCEPALWSQRAFWLLAGTIYQRLAVDCEALETAELVALAKALAENRRAEGHATVSPGPPAAEGEGGGEAKDELRQLVHELYGLHLPDGADAHDAPKS